MSKPENPNKQVKAFRKIAREVGCTEDEAAFDDALKQVAKAPAKESNDGQTTKDKKRAIK
jgi:hypothetical protein